MIARHKQGFAAIGAVALALLGVLIAWSVIQIVNTQNKVVRIEQRQIRDERPTERQLVQGILHALAVCHASPQCSKSLEQAKHGINPQTGRPVKPIPSHTVPSHPGGATTGTVLRSAPGLPPPARTPRRSPQPHRPSQAPNPQPQPQPQPRPPVPLPGPVPQVLCGLLPAACHAHVKPLALPGLFRLPLAASGS